MFVWLGRLKVGVAAAGEGAVRRTEGRAGAFDAFTGKHRLTESWGEPQQSEGLRR